MAERAVLLDLDGTLVDSVYYHVVLWHQALTDAGYDVTLKRVHDAIGMGSRRLMAYAVGHHPDDAATISDEHTRRFVEHASALRPTPGSLALIDDLETRGVPFMVATSAGSEERKVLLGALGREDLPTTDASDAESSKPAADLLLVACEQLGVTPTHATLVGDAPWDAEAAERVGVRSIAVRCGGFGDAALRDHGAMRIVDTPRELIGQL